LTCINTGLNFSLLYQTFGWSLKLVAGIFSSITHYLMHNAHHHFRQQQQSEEEDHSSLNIDRQRVQSIRMHNVPFKPNTPLITYNQKQLYPNIHKISM